MSPICAQQALLWLQIYSKTGQWEDAVKVLDTLQAQVSAQLRFSPYTLNIEPTRLL